MNVVIIDSKGGNVRSVKNALDRIGIPHKISFDKKIIENAGCIILPGQGHFGAIMSDLQKKGLVGLLQRSARTKPFLGICIGMQLLLEKSEEAFGTPGLEIAQGSSKKFPKGLSIPHMGWNTVSFSKDSRFHEFEGDYYFAHSYCCDFLNKSFVKGWFEYTKKYPAVFETDKILATQFHPEKSGDLGLELLKKFMELYKR